MPQLEAPAGFGESSPENSLTSELLAVVGPMGHAPDPPPAPAPVALPYPIIEIHVQTPPEPRRAAPDMQRLPPINNNTRHILPPRRGSYDRDIPAQEEENYFSLTQPYLLPVVLPQVTEPTLDELLRRVTERNDLHNVESVRLRVISYTVSLSRLALFLPRLQHLDLSGSVLSSLRDLGYGLLQLTHLNVSNCGLSSFDGTGGLPGVRVLIADNNMIQRVGPLAELPLLQRLSVRHNSISELGLLSFLGLCPNLVELELQGNPVCHLVLYRTTLQRSVPTLQVLDGQPLRAEPQTTTNTAITINTNINTVAASMHASHASSTDGELSSLSSEVYSASNVETESDSLDGGGGSMEAEHQRPSTAPHNIVNSNSQPAYRPASVSVSVSDGRQQRSDSLSMGGAPVVGSVLGLARQHRQRRQRRGHAWVSSSSSASSSDASTRPPSATSIGSFESQPVLPSTQPSSQRHSP